MRTASGNYLVSGRAIRKGKVPVQFVMQSVEPSSRFLISNPFVEGSQETDFGRWCLVPHLRLGIVLALIFVSASFAQSPTTPSTEHAGLNWSSVAFTPCEGLFVTYCFVFFINTDRWASIWAW